MKVIDRLPIWSRRARPVAVSPAQHLLETSEPLPRRDAEWLAAGLLATQMNRGFPAAAALADHFAAAGVHLPLARRWNGPAEGLLS